MYLISYCIYTCIYWTNVFIYLDAIYAEVIQMYLFSLQCKFYCTYTLNAYFIHVFT